jgi:hypothetical protein
MKRSFVCFVTLRKITVKKIVEISKFKIIFNEKRTNP